jgi:predicted nucleotidyltransferase
MNLIDQNIYSIIQLCEKHSVDNLFLFGSILTDKFSPESDIDFLVNFEEVDLYQYFDNYMNFKESLEQLLHRPVDLLEEKTIKNSFLRKSIDRNKKQIYGRANSKMAV